MAPAVRLIECDWPEFGGPLEPVRFTAVELAARIQRTRDAMQRSGLTHLCVYGDPEHFASLAWLTGFDPRFEEALLILDLTGPPLLLVGVECVGYLKVSPLWNEGGLRHECYQPFSLVGIDRGGSRSLSAILEQEGIQSGSQVGFAGWKYFPGHPEALEVPSYLADAVRCLVAPRPVINASALFQHPEHGLRTFCTASEVAWLESMNVLASDGMRRMIHAIREGMTDHELAGHMGFNGLPLGCHWTLKTGQNRISLASPMGAVVKRGNPLSGNVCFRGANCCRAGWLAYDRHDLPAEAAGYEQEFAAPYFAAMAEWFGMLRIGVTGGVIDARMRELLPAVPFGLKLNPGHLIHWEEWISTPVEPGSTIPLRSGMAMQSDVIPSSPRYFSSRMEDTYVLADQHLQDQLASAYPGCLARCKARRDFMRHTLGLPIEDEVLPLSNIAGIVPPYLLSPARMFAMDPSAG